MLAQSLSFQAMEEFNKVFQDQFERVTKTPMQIKERADAVSNLQAEFVEHAQVRSWRGCLGHARVDRACVRACTPSRRPWPAFWWRRK